jgi:hypothetical protein
MLRAVYPFTDLQELPSDGDSLLVFARVVKLDNPPIEGISLGGILRLSRVPPTARNAEQGLPVRSGAP